MPLHTIRDWLGHTNIAQTSTYLAGTAKTQHDARCGNSRSGASQLTKQGPHRTALAANERLCPVALDPCKKSHTASLRHYARPTKVVPLSVRPFSRFSTKQ